MSPKSCIEFALIQYSLIYFNALKKGQFRALFVYFRAILTEKKLQTLAGFELGSSLQITSTLTLPILIVITPFRPLAPYIVFSFQKRSEFSDIERSSKLVHSSMRQRFAQNKILFQVWPGLLKLSTDDLNLIEFSNLCHSSQCDQIWRFIALWATF